MNIVADAAKTVMKKALALAPDSWIPGGIPDPLIRHKHGLVGSPVSRLDGRLKVTGAAPFAAEFPLAGMVYAALAFSTIAKGRIATLDTTAAEASSGVVLVMTYRNASRMKPLPYFMQAPKAAAGDNLPIMQDDRIHWNGQPIAVVLAETQEQADHAAALIRASFDAEPATTGFEQSKAKGLYPTSFAGEPLLVTKGDAEATLAAAPVSIDATYRTPRHNHNALEPHAVTVSWSGDELTMHDASQGVSHVAWSLGEAFGVGEEHVRVTSPYVGGGFGGKTLWQHHMGAAAAPRRAARPVRLALSR